MTDEIMYELMQLSGQEYVDMYATKAKSMTSDAALLVEQLRRGRARRRPQRRRLSPRPYAARTCRVRR